MPQLRRTTGEPYDMKVSSTVRRGTDGKGAQATSPAVYPTMPTRHQITVEFAFLLDDRVLWKGREGVYTIIWRRWHQGQVGEHVIYGICRVGEESNPVAQVYTAIESDLRLAPGQIAR